MNKPPEFVRGGKYIAIVAVGDTRDECQARLDEMSEGKDGINPYACIIDKAFLVDETIPEHDLMIVRRGAVVLSFLAAIQAQR